MVRPLSRTKEEKKTEPKDMWETSVPAYVLWVPQKKWHTDIFYFI